MFLMCPLFVPGFVSFRCSPRLLLWTYLPFSAFVLLVWICWKCLVHAATNSFLCTDSPLIVVLLIAGERLSARTIIRHPTLFFDYWNLFFFLFFPPQFPREQFYSVINLRIFLVSRWYFNEFCRRYSNVSHVLLPAWQNLPGRYFQKTIIVIIWRKGEAFLFLSWSVNYYYIQGRE